MSSLKWANVTQGSLSRKPWSLCSKSVTLPLQGFFWGLTWRETLTICTSANGKDHPPAKSCSHGAGRGWFTSASVASRPRRSSHFQKERKPLETKLKEPLSSLGTGLALDVRRGKGKTQGLKSVLFSFYDLLPWPESFQREMLSPLLSLPGPTSEGTEPPSIRRGPRKAWDKGRRVQAYRFRLRSLVL